MTNVLINVCHNSNSIWRLEMKFLFFRSTDEKIELAKGKIKLEKTNSKAKIAKIKSKIKLLKKEGKKKK